MRVNKGFKRLLCTLIILIFNLTHPSYAIIPTGSDPTLLAIVTAMESNTEVIKQLGEFLGKTVAHMGTLMYGTDMDPETQSAFYTLVGQCIAANVSELASRQGIINNAAARMQYDMYSAINTEQASNNVSAMAQSVPIHGNPYLTDPQHQTNNVSMDSLMNTTTLNQNTAQEARNFITFITQLSEPFQQPYSLDEISKGLEANQEMQQFVAKLGTFAANSSVGLSNYNYFYYERLMQPGLGQAAGIYQFNADGSPGPSIPDASPLQIDEFMAKRRAVDPRWYTFLAELPPAAVQRELTTIMAEIRYELYKQRILKEREVATLSAMQLTLSHYAEGRLVSSEQKFNERVGNEDDTQAGVGGGSTSTDIQSSVGGSTPDTSV